MAVVEFTPQIPFVQDHQKGKNLCWIALAVCVKNHFGGSTLQQCELAKALLNIRGACCTQADKVPKRCDKPGQLEVALDEVSHLAVGTAANPNPKGGGPMTFAEIKAQIDKRLPVCIFIKWVGQTFGHFSLISGYDESSGKEYVYVNDPLYGSGPQPYARVVSNYHMDHGSWQYTYRLKV
jgi:hypothetical protein